MLGISRHTRSVDRSVVPMIPVQTTTSEEEFDERDNPRARVGTPLAQAEVGPTWPSTKATGTSTPAVQADVLRVTERTYTCPYKGTCNWVDYVGPDGRTVRDVAWVYPKVKPGHEVIQGRYGFYAGSRNATREES